MAKKYTVLHKKSNVLVNGEPKLPSASTLQYGEIAINYGVGGETLSIKNSADEVVEFISKNKIGNNFYTKTEADGKFITGYTETDPTVPAWAKSENKPAYTADEVGAMAASERGNYLTTAATIPTEASIEASGFTKNAITGINVNGAAATVTNGVAEINVQGGGGSTLPSVTAADNGKALMVVDGDWATVMPATVYTGTDMPLSSTGNDGDIYLQTTYENYTEPDARASVLWVGTSIPAGTPENNYPQMVADALGFKLYNNSIGASFVTFYPNNGNVNDESYNWQNKSDIKEHVGYCLSATKQDVENKFRPILERIKANDSSMTDADIEYYIGLWKWASYEDRIIPYVDGTIASCDVVVIDHGYNDRDNIVASAANYADATLDYSSTTGAGGTGDKYPDPNRFRGWYFINHFGDRDYYQGELYMNGCYQHAIDGTGGMKHEYIGALMHIIMAIKKANPNTRIVIGNYFAQRHPYQDDLSPYICRANEGVAKWLSLQCVNVYQYTGIINKTYTDNSGNTQSDFWRFCPDGVHPHTDSTGHSNRVIAGVYINALRGICYK